MPALATRTRRYLRQQTVLGSYAASTLRLDHDGRKPVAQPLDLALEVLEANPALTPSSNPYAEALAMSMAPPAGARTIEDLPHAIGGDNAPMSEEQRKNLLAMMRARGV